MTTQPRDFREDSHNWRERPLSTRERSGAMLIIGVVVLMVLLKVGLSWFGSETPIIRSENTAAYASDVFMEFISVAATVLILDRWSRMREDEREERRLKERLVREAASRSNERAKSAIDDLRHYGWLEGGDSLLKNADLSGANLAGADLIRANLQGAKLDFAKLQEVNLIGAKLQEAHLMLAKLQGAKLMLAKLQGANLMLANLQAVNLREVNLQSADLSRINLQGSVLSRANLQSANLRGANLHGAHLSRANLRNAIFHDKDIGTAIMPNGEPWHEGMDLEMFTNPDHPNFFDPRKTDASSE